MLTARLLSAGALSEADALKAHLLEPTISGAQADIAAYYARQEAMDDAMADGLGSIPITRSDIDPALAELLGLEPGGIVGEKQFGAILSGRRSDGEDLPTKKQKTVKTKDGQERHKVSGIDLCFSAPKSFSVAWALAKS